MASKGPRPEQQADLPGRTPERHERARDSFRETQAGLCAMFDLMTDLVHVRDDDHRVRFMNRALIDRIGRDATGEFCFAAVRQQATVCPWCRGGRASQGRAERFQVTLPRDGRTYDAIHARLMLPDRAYAWVSILHDVTREREVQDQLRHAERIAMIGALAAGVTHEFRNLHAVIEPLCEMLLRDGSLVGQKRDDVRAILAASRRGTAIACLLLDFAKRRTCRKEPCRLEDVVQDVVDIVRSEFAGEGIELAVRHNRGLPRVRVARQLMGEVVLNLLMNARHALRDRPEKRITVATAHRGAHTVISVSDTGCGIPPEEVGKIFGTLCTAKAPPDKGESPSAGLGLAVSEAIVRDHGGEIQVHSVVGQGTTFTVSLPLENSPLDAVSPGPRPQESPPHATVLVVDHDRAVCRLVKRALEEMGHRVDTAHSDTEALALLARGPYDLALVDVEVPDTPGWAVLRTIDEMPAEHRPARIVMTQKPIPDQVRTEGRQTVHVLGKPFHIDRLRRVIGHALTGRA